MSADNSDARRYLRSRGWHTAAVSGHLKWMRYDTAEFFLFDDAVAAQLESDRADTAFVLAAMSLGDWLAVVNRIVNAAHKEFGKMDLSEGGQVAKLFKPAVDSFESWLRGVVRDEIAKSSGLDF